MSGPLPGGGGLVRAAAGTATGTATGTAAGRVR